MSRLWKFLPLAAIIAVLPVFTSCNSTNAAKIRVINAIPDVSGGAVDVYLNQAPNGTKIASSLAFGQMNPSTNPPATYTNVTDGKNEVDVYVAGTTSPILNRSIATFTGSTEYTLVLDGFTNSNLPPTLLTDNNTTPNTGYLEFRVINAAPSSGGPGVDVYIYPANTTLPATPQISALVLGQGVYAPAVVYSSSNGYSVTVTPHANPFSYFVNQVYNPASGSITTLVIVNVSQGQSVSQTPLAFTDLQ